MLVFLRETYAPIIILGRKKVEELHKETTNTPLRSGLGEEEKSRSASKKVLQRALLRPWKLMLMSPVLDLVSLWAALAYGYTYILLTSLAPIYEDVYGFSANLLGLTYLGIGVGTLIGTGIYSATADRYLAKKSDEFNEKARLEGRPEAAGLQPEHRLFLFPLAALLLPAGMLLYGGRISTLVCCILYTAANQIR